MTKWLLLVLMLAASGCSVGRINNSLSDNQNGERITGGFVSESSRDRSRHIEIKRAPTSGPAAPTPVRPTKYSVSIQNGKYVITAIGE